MAHDDHNEVDRSPFKRAFEVDNKVGLGLVEGRVV